MAYIEGFLLPCPTANKQAFIEQASGMAPIFKRLGGTRVVEAWGDDVPEGKLNDCAKRFQATEDEAIGFSWIEYPDRAARDAANERMRTDPEMQDDGAMVFDGKRMIFSGFEIVSDVGPGGETGFIDGVILPVPTANKAAYVDYSHAIANVFVEHGATRVVDSWGDDVPDGKVTDYNRATLKQDDETVVYSWVEWPSKAIRDAAWEKLMKDERMQPDRSTASA